MNISLDSNNGHGGFITLLQAFTKEEKEVTGDESSILGQTFLKLVDGNVLGVSMGINGGEVDE